MRWINTSLLCAVVTVALAGPFNTIKASELVWTPINPSFGGSSFNGAWLMASAQAQDKIVPETPAPKTKLQEFQDRLNSQVLYQLSDKILAEAFGEGGLLPEGETGASYDVGNYNVEVTSDLAGINVILTDVSTGGSTTLTVPYF